MDTIVNLFEHYPSGGLMPVVFLMIVMGAAAIVYPFYTRDEGRKEILSRLAVSPLPQKTDTPQPAKQARDPEIAAKAAKRAADFYMKSDPDNVIRVRLRLMQAGYMNPGAVGIYFLIRFAGLFIGGAGMLAFIMLSAGDVLTVKGLLLIVGGAATGYFAPGLALARQISMRQREYRNGFPDFMDLMIVCADAGMSLEAAIDRVAREIRVTYPELSQNIALVSLELRAGRSIDEALKSLGERLGLDEVRSFATLLQQSKELGTSLSGALKVFSDEMRHKRMSAAEEKAHALPAKMSVPVTVCILPVIVMIAIIPIIVKFNTGSYTF